MNTTTKPPAHQWGTEGIQGAAQGRPMSYGERLVGLAFNPGGDTAVYTCKAEYAAVIDRMNSLRETSMDNEVRRMCSIAITEAQVAQMWAVKALTWKPE